jgi:hypothetical protein
MTHVCWSKMGKKKKQLIICLQTRRIGFDVPFVHKGKQNISMYLCSSKKKQQQRRNKKDTPTTRALNLPTQPYPFYTIKKKKLLNSVSSFEPHTSCIIQIKQLKQLKLSGC